MKTITLPDGTVFDDEIVAQYYKMDPMFDDVIYADELEEGMVVLSVLANRCDENNVSVDHEKLLQYNRWRLVTKLREDADRIVFIAAYADGSKVINKSGRTDGWIVKKASIPKAPEPKPFAGMSYGDWKKKDQERRDLEDRVGY